jgi:crossover junction endodeoxyribonuclease RuvC
LIVLGIDPGSVRTGWGVLDARGRQVTALDWGIIKMQSKTPLAQRLVTIHDGIAAVCQDHKVEGVAVEGIFQGGGMKNVRSVLTLGHARGAALLAVAQLGLEVSEYAPAEVKKALVGTGRAQKYQMQEMVRTVLGLSELPAEDAADALSVAVCHSFRLQNPGIGRTR